MSVLEAEDCEKMDIYPLKLIFEGKDAQQGLPLYDGSVSFAGFGQALQMAINAYRTGKPSAWATSLKGAKVVFGSPRKGSVIFDLEARFETPCRDAPSSKEAFYDFLRVAFRRATGSLDEEGQTSYVQKTLVKDETLFDDLADRMEGALQRAHRVIDNDLVTVSLARPRSSLVTFNRVTSAWVNTRDEEPHVKRYTGHMTRYNTKTGNGRAYINEVGKIIPIRQSDKFPNKDLLTWSLHGDNIDVDKKLEFFGKGVMSAKNDMKRIMLSNCSQIK